ncbi:TPA: hypothetical protein MYQ41_005440 [Citrobacter amalonaticus]|nr:hypothetical protein [Citrobacter amalonaticus]HCB1864774.1 hypothetical protein [Citrobacter amalonaticus]HCB1913715.1 hypothetical protein [Citrobacter amalonaticus]HCB1914116.1 hypothetical protein [Citrobacter amalonaticus]
MSATSGVFSIVFIGLLGASIATPSLAWLVTKLPRKSQGWIYSMLAALAVSIWAISALDISSPNPRFNAIAIISALWAVLVVLLSAYRLRSRLLRHTLGTFAILLLVACVFMGTLGGLATAFMVGESVPIFSASEASGRACYVTSYGNATTDFGGYNITIAKQITYAPFLETVVMRKQYEKPQKRPEELCAANI